MLLNANAIPSGANKRADRGPTTIGIEIFLVVLI